MGKTSWHKNHRQVRVVCDFPAVHPRSLFLSPVRLKLCSDRGTSFFSCRSKRVYYNGNADEYWNWDVQVTSQISFYFRKLHISRSALQCSYARVSIDSPSVGLCVLRCISPLFHHVLVRLVQTKSGVGDGLVFSTNDNGLWIGQLQVYDWRQSFLVPPSSLSSRRHPVSVGSASAAKSSSFRFTLS